MSQSNPILFICTVGGSPEPLIASIKQWKPSKVFFLPSKQTAKDVEGIVTKASEEGFQVPIGCYETQVIPDAQNFADCVESFRKLTDEVRKWLARGENYEVVVDFTGGTKCMTAALALQAHQWHCKFSYVGGSERTKDGVGIVVSGKEQIVHAKNPWDALGYQAVEEAVVLFNQGARAAASRRLEISLRQISSEPVKRELSTLKSLTDAYDAWDRFQHKDALNRLKDVLKNANDLPALFGQSASETLKKTLSQHAEYLNQLVPASDKPTRTAVLDLLANAKRREDEGRHDDAVARLYRAIEAIAQVILAEKHGIEDTGKVPQDTLSEALRNRWRHKADNGIIKLGLQDDYTLLRELNDRHGEQFEKLKWHERKSPLTERNKSILAHGFKPVGETIFEQLWQGSLQLAKVTEQDLPEFPLLPCGS